MSDTIKDVRLRLPVHLLEQIDTAAIKDERSRHAFILRILRAWSVAPDKLTTSANFVDAMDAAMEDVKQGRVTRYTQSAPRRSVAPMFKEKHK